MTDPLRAALTEWDAIEGSDLAAQFRAFGAAGKMADAIRAVLAADTARPGLDVEATQPTWLEDPRAHRRKDRP